MKGKRYTADTIIKILSEAEVGSLVAEALRRQGVSGLHLGFLL